MGSLPLRVWIEILGRVEVEALGHTVDPYSGAQMQMWGLFVYTYDVTS